MEEAAREWTIGVDTGGTFTDVVLVDEHRTIIATHKLPSTPDDPARAVIEGIAAIVAKIPNREASEAVKPHITHGSTVATNALLEGKGDRTAFITTKGFEDLLAIGRQNRPDLYALEPRKPVPPVLRELCFGAAERMRMDGAIIAPMSVEAIKPIIEQVKAADVDSIAICLLHSYANSSHERAIMECVNQVFHGVESPPSVTLSSELLPEYREYERAATCIVNARVAPMMSRYLGRLTQHVGEHRLRIMASSGGTLPVQSVIEQPIQTILSGPAGGVVGALQVAISAGQPRIISFDMGGTSTDVSLCDNGLSRTHETEIGGLPVRLPMVDIHTVGAGGGSIAWIDDGGALRVGPQSAGAEPGPACYGKQNPEEAMACVTDAHVVLGHLADRQRLGESLCIDAELARAAVQGVADRVGLTLFSAAEGILRIAEVTMGRAIQEISVQRGHDARAFTLVPFGGAGGLHACRLAEQLGIDRILVPRDAGLLSAVGMLGAPPMHTFSMAVLASICCVDGRYESPMKQEMVVGVVDALRSRGHAALEADGIDHDCCTLHAQLDLRFAGQSYEITVDATDGDAIEVFLRQHQRLYDYVPSGKAIEVVTARVIATGPSRPVVAMADERMVAANEGGSNTRTVYDGDGRETSWFVRDRHTCNSGELLRGPLIISEYSATTLVLPGWSARVHETGAILLERVGE